MKVFLEIQFLEVINDVGIKWLSIDTLLVTGADTTSGYTMKTNLKMEETQARVIILYEK
ncbi:MAG: hypothetical protein QM763_08985 [Agriterribacter sp.]